MYLKTEKESGHCLLSLWIQPNSSKTKVVGEYNGHLKVKLKAPPIDGKANAEIIAFLSEILDLGRNKFEFLQGDKNRQKLLLIKSTELNKIQAKISSLIQEDA